MNQSQGNFEFLATEYPKLNGYAVLAEKLLYVDPTSTLVKLRLAAEKITDFIGDYEGVEFYRMDQSRKIGELKFCRVIPYEVSEVLHKLRKSGNKAAHDGEGDGAKARFMLHEFFKLAKWFYEVYEEEEVLVDYVRPPKEQFDEDDQVIEDLENKVESLQDTLKEYEEKLKSFQSASEKEIEIRHERGAQIIHKIDEKEADTRERIDAQLRDAGWICDTEEINFKTKKTLPEKGKNMAIAEWPCGNKWADYALFVGTELIGIVEAKKYSSDISSDLTQSKLYGELVEEKHDAKLAGKWRNYNVPFLFATNSREYLEQIKTKSGIWFLDVRSERNRARALRSWYSPEGLYELLKQDIDQANEKLKSSELDYLQSPNGLGLRDYQINAIRAVEEKLIPDTESRRTLIEMATGTGKTRTIIGLCYRLIKANRFKRILFLVDRRLLATQAIGAFNDTKIENINTFGETYKVEGLKETFPDIETRLHFATVQGMVKRLYYSDDEADVLSGDTYDCIIVDEAHRGYLQDKQMDDEEMEFKNQLDFVSKYRMVLDHFDAHAIGLTATPALHTKEIFGKPVFTYSYREAVIDGYLIDHEPPYLIKTKLSEEGIKWEKGEKPKVYDKEENRIVELSELEDELEIDVAGFNKMVITESFNRTVVKQLVKELDPDGEEKTLIFAAKDEHADRIVMYLKEEFENIGNDVPDEAIMKLTGKTHEVHEWVKRFKNEKYPNIGVTVDLLTTGIDVPAITNLVFLRRIRSRILYEQMLGRATRLCPDIHKETFRIYDAVRLYEALEDFSNMKPVVPNPTTSFQQLSEEMKEIKSNERAQVQLEQIIAKLQRKKGQVVGGEIDQFKYRAEDKDPESFINMLKSDNWMETPQQVMQYTSLWKYLDELRPGPAVQYFSEHGDEYLGTDRGYGKGEKPEDYIESFQKFVNENRNKIDALQIVCSKPTALDRESLKELRLLLDQEGFTANALNSAWKQTKNEEIAADIISFIRTLALGTSLMSHEERIHKAVEQVRGMKDWNKVQLKWIDRFEKQLMKETVLQASDIDEDPFDEAGGFQRLDKIFEHQLNEVIDVINENLYSA